MRGKQLENEFNPLLNYNDLYIHSCNSYNEIILKYRL